MNKYQEAKFWDLARSAVEHVSWEGKDSDNFDDSTLFVEKIKGKGWYHIEYVVQMNILFKTKYRTKMDIKPKTADFRDSSGYQYKNYTSDFDDIN